MNGNHLKLMLLGGAGLLGVLLLVGASVQTALLLAVVLACPLMMLAMGGHDGDRSTETRDDAPQDTDRAHHHRHGS